MRKRAAIAAVFFFALAGLFASQSIFAAEDNKTHKVVFKAGDGDFGTGEKTRTVQVSHGEVLTADQIVEPNAPKGFRFTDWKQLSDEGSVITTEQLKSLKVHVDLEIEAKYTRIEAEEVKTKDIRGTIEWLDVANQDGIRPEEVELTLFRGEDPTEYKTTAKKNSANSAGWTFTFKDVPATDEQGEPIAYTVRQKAVPGYDTTYGKDGLSLINRHDPETKVVKVIIEWKDDQNKAGKRPETVKLSLLGNGDSVYTDFYPVDRENSEMAVELKNIDVNRNGKPIVHTLVQNKLDDYETKITSDGDTITVVNTYVGEMPNPQSEESSESMKPDSESEKSEQQKPQENDSEKPPVDREKQPDDKRIDPMDQRSEADRTDSAEKPEATEKSTQTEKTDQAKTLKKAPAPKTGDVSGVLLYGAAAISAGVGMFALKKRGIRK